MNARIHTIPVYILTLLLLLPFWASAEAANPCQCVQWLRAARGHVIKGDAWTLRPSKPITQATEGDILLTTEGPGHAAEIIGFEGEVDMGSYIRPAYIKLLEANYVRCQVGTRLIPWDSPEIRGIY